MTICSDDFKKYMNVQRDMGNAVILTDGSLNYASFQLLLQMRKEVGTHRPNISDFRHLV